MGLPVLIEGGDLTVNAKYLISVRRGWVDDPSGCSEGRRLRARVVMRRGLAADLWDDDARQFLDALKPLTEPRKAEPSPEAGGAPPTGTLGRSARPPSIAVHPDDPDDIPRAEPE